MVTVHRGPGWKIAVYARDHGIPHFHIEGPGFRCSVSIAKNELIVGNVPPSVLKAALRMGACQSRGTSREVAGVERMSRSDIARTILSAKAKPPATLALRWSDGTRAAIDLSAILREHPFRPLRDSAAFARVRVGEWGHSVEWPSGPELSAETLWLETLTATGHRDTRAFLEWRLRHGLSLTKAAEALGVSRRMVAYYSNGEKPVPRPILLACKGWEVSHAA